MALRSARLGLTPVTDRDGDELHRLWTSPGVRRFLWDGEIIAPERTAEAVAASAALFATHGFGLWVARVPGSTAIAGFTGLWPFRDPPEFELLFGVAEPLWGRGYAVEIAQAVLDHCRTPLAMTEVRASTDAANHASVRVLEKLGFTQCRREIVDGLDTRFFELSLIPDP